MERGNNSYGQETVMAKNWDKIGVLGCNSVIPRNVGEPPTGDGTAVGNGASAAAGSVAVGDGAAANHGSSVALGSHSATSKDNEVSLGIPATDSVAEVTREVTHVSEPTAPSSAATKAYVDTAVGDINVIAPKTVDLNDPASVALDNSLAIGQGAKCESDTSTQMAIGPYSDAIGSNSIAVGMQNEASGNYSTSIGLYTHSYGDYSIAMGVHSNAAGKRSVAIGDFSQSIGNYAEALTSNSYVTGNTSQAVGYQSSACATQSTAIGSGATVIGSAVPDPDTKDFKATTMNSVALGSFSVADEPNTVSVGNNTSSISIHRRTTNTTTGKLNDTAPFWEVKTVNFPASAQYLKRRLTNVADPIDGHNAATKNYVDANTSNAFTNKAYGNPTVHVEDAWPSPLLGVLIGGAYKQGDTVPKPPIVEGDEPSHEDQVLSVTGADTSDTGTSEQSDEPSLQNPVPIEVLENPVLRVTGADTSAAGVSLPITLPAEHPYLAALPDGTCDEIVIDKDGNATLVAMVGRDTDVREITDVAVGQYFGLKTTLPPFASADALKSSSALCSAIPYLVENYGVYRTWNGVCVKYQGQEDKDQLQAVFEAAVPMTVLAPIPEERYSLGKLDIPSLPETVSNVWVEGSLSLVAKTAVMYKLDANKTVLRPSSSIIFENGSVKVNQGIFGDGLLATDNNVRVDSNFINDRIKEFVRGLNYSFFGPFTVEFSSGFTGTKNEFGEIQHSYDGNIEHYEIYKANFEYTLTRDYTAGTKIEFRVQFKYGGNHATVTKTTITKVVNLATGLTVAHVTPKYDSGYHPEYIFSVPVSTDIPSGTKLAFFMELCN